MPVPAYAAPVSFTEYTRASHRKWVRASRKDARRDRARHIFIAVVFRATNPDISVPRRLQYLATARRLGAISEG